MRHGMWRATPVALPLGHQPHFYEATTVNKISTHLDRGIGRKHADSMLLEFRVLFAESPFYPKMLQFELINASLNKSSGWALNIPCISVLTGLTVAKPHLSLFYLSKFSFCYLPRFLQLE